MRKPRRPDPEVHESDYRVPTAVGTAAWTVALIVLLVRGDRIAEADRWWVWVCVTGIALGVFAFFYIPHLLRKRAEAERRSPSTANDEADESRQRPTQRDERPQRSHP